MVGEGLPSTTCAGHGTEPGGESPLRADRPEPLAKGNCVTARSVERKLEANLGTDEQDIGYKAGAVG